MLAALWRAGNPCAQRSAAPCLAQAPICLPRRAAGSCSGEELLRVGLIVQHFQNRCQPGLQSSAGRALLTLGPCRGHLCADLDPLRRAAGPWLAQDQAPQDRCGLQASQRAGSGFLGCSCRPRAGRSLGAVPPAQPPCSLRTCGPRATQHSHRMALCQGTSCKCLQEAAGCKLRAAAQNLARELLD